jgi:hypothetical protein
MKRLSEYLTMAPGRRWMATALLISLIAGTPALALYDPKPVEPLAQFEGAWIGSLTYKDYQDPTREVTLPTQMFVALAEPGKLALHYVYDDGPKKIVHSYEALSIDLAAKTAL